MKRKTTKRGLRPVELLEGRELMAATLTATLAGKLLVIQGTAASDTIQVREQDGLLTVDGTTIKVGRQQHVGVSVGRVSRVVVDGLQGDDLINLAADDAATVSRSATIRAGDGNDTVFGGHAADLIYGGEGNDLLFGLAGPDQMYAQGGNDQVYGGTGNDRLDAGTGMDFLGGSDGKDRLIATGKDDYVNGEPGEGFQGVAVAYAGQSEQLALKTDARLSATQAGESPYATLARAVAAADASIYVGNVSVALGLQAPTHIHVGGEIMRVVNRGFEQWTVERGQIGTRAQAHAQGTPIYRADQSTLTGRLEISGQPDRDYIETTRGKGLVLVSNPAVSPGDQGENSKTVTVWVKGWESNTSTRVELLLLGANGERVLLPTSIPNNLPNKMKVFPGEGNVQNQLLSVSPANMFNPGVSDQREYAMSVNFGVLRGATAEITPVTLVVRQGTREYRVALDLVVRTPLTPPTTVGPTGSVAARAPTFSWQPVPGATRYEVVVQDTRNVRVLYAPAVDVTKWTANAFLSPGVQYNWWVRGIGGDGKPGPWSVTRSFVVTSDTMTSAPPAPTSFRWEPSSGTTIKVTWSPVAGATAYVIEYLGAAGWTKIYGGGVEATTVYVSSGLGLTYRIGAVNGFGRNYTAPFVAAALTAPTGLRWTPGTGRNGTLSWSDTAGETGYVIQRYEGGRWVVIAQVGANVTSISAPSGAGYYYSVGASNAIETKYSNPFLAP